MTDKSLFFKHGAVESDIPPLPCKHNGWIVVKNGIILGKVNAFTAYQALQEACTKFNCYLENSEKNNVQVFLLPLNLNLIEIK